LIISGCIVGLNAAVGYITKSYISGVGSMVMGRRHVTKLQWFDKQPGCQHWDMPGLL
jgi:hypothetical protein